MIESILIARIATFGNVPEPIEGLSTFNFIFGSNATGKTTISRVIADEGSYSTCQVNWKGGTKLQTMVYNRDFVERNFNQSTELKGVFTLGEKNLNTLEKIKTAKTQFDSLTETIKNLKVGLHGDNGSGGKKEELAFLETEIKEKCWAQKQKHDAKLQGAFEGLRNNAEKFKEKVLQELDSNTATLKTLVELESKADTVLGPAPTIEKFIPALETDAMLGHETHPILKKRVIGKKDIDIAAMIKKLGNSDWVRVGRAFYDTNEGVCPFCQQGTPKWFANSLNEYFDETFETDSKAIADLITNYKTDSERLKEQIAAIIADPPKFLDIEKLKTEKHLLDSTVTVNVQSLALKRKEPSQIVELDSISNVLATIKDLIGTANSLAAEHNKLVANIAQERNDLKAQIWKYLLEVELKADLSTYKLKRETLVKAITGMEQKILNALSDRKKNQDEIRELEKQTTSIQPTIDDINALLSSFGFQGFFLARAENAACYKLVRPDGTDAKESLSEGEKTFVTFLYFYHLLKGSESESGMTTDRVVVFDDPVSSLDSDILFLVGSLIKGLFGEVLAGTGHIKQVFLLTHNVYFHKEVTFNPKGRNVKKETFWVVQKSGLESKVVKHNSNPIKTSYEFLWAEIRKPDYSSLTIQNTLRRILENYFKILGSVDPDEICEKFGGKGKLICKSLFSWVNAGSHYALDDLYVSSDDTMVDTYLNVFREIFEKTGHLAHYKMMMGDAYMDPPAKEELESFT
jgi:wobble nucleotide-excising tRNase